VLVPPEHAELVAIGDAPKPDRAVVAGGGERAAVWGEGDPVDLVSVPAEDGPGPARCPVPEPRRAVPAAARQRGGVARGGHAIDLAAVLAQRGLLPMRQGAEMAPGEFTRVRLAGPGRLAIEDGRGLTVMAGPQQLRRHADFGHVPRLPRHEF